MVRWFWMAPLVITALLVSACTFVVQPASDSPAIAPEDEGAVSAPAALFVLPDGNECSFAGTGATLAFDGTRVNYSCSMAPEEKSVVILGDPAPSGVTEWAAEVGVIGRDDGGFVLESTELIEYTVWDLALVGGARCLHAGFGATLAFDDKRVNYSCTLIAADAAGPANGGEWVILGEPTNAGEGVWLADRAEIVRGADGYAIVAREEVAISLVNGVAHLVGEASPDNALLGTAWQWLRSEYGDDSVVEAADPTRYTVAFGEDGALAAQVDCNRGVGRYTVDGVGLTIEPLATTRVMCPEGSQDAIFLRDLGQVVTYLIEDGNLYLAMALDTGIMVLAPVE